RPTPLAGGARRGAGRTPSQAAPLRAVPCGLVRDMRGAVLGLGQPAVAEPLCQPAVQEAGAPLGEKAHLERWEPIPVIFKDKAGRDRQLDGFFAPRERGKGIMPTATTYGYHFKKACKAAGLVG